jgi:hypothetical protein
LEGELKRRLKLGFITLLALVAVGAFTSVAGAQINSGLPAGALNPAETGDGNAQIGAGFDPQETNIPYLAWRGEQLRFVKCNDELSSEGGQTANFSIAGWSGELGNEPTFVPGSVSFWTNRNGDPCVAGDFYGNKPGIAMIKLKVTDNATGRDVMVHDFLGIWMAIGSASFSNATVAERAGTDIANLVDIQVSGSVPLNSNWRTDRAALAAAAGACPSNVDTAAFAGGATCLTLPDDWAAIAHSLASTSAAQRQSNPGIAAWQYWDIHDSSGPGGDGGNPDIHVPGFCPPPNNTSTTIDQVDNCIGGGEFDAFSRVFGDSTNPTYGPFDPQYPEQTLLSDGNLNAFDAPMPPLRVNVSSNGNTGFFEDVNTAGAPLPGADKHVIYSRDGLGSPTPHNLYAPFYGEYIPATSRSLDAAGTDCSQDSGPAGQPDGESCGNNFEGYLVEGLYHFWNIADVLTNAEGQPSNCLLRYVNGDPIFRFTNDGPQSIAIYTDEHGEAVAQWSPGLNNDLFNPSTLDINGACDVQGMNLGGASITATAQYPAQNVADAFPVAGTITKQVLNLFNKSVSCIRKNNGPNGGQVYVCTVSAQDINGAGAVFNGEYVCVSREPFGTVYSNYSGTLSGPLFGSPGEACVPLHGGGGPADADGTPHPATAVVETPATLNGTPLDISAYFEDELIWRDACVQVGAQLSTNGPCGTPSAPIELPGTNPPGSGPTPPPIGVTVITPTVGVASVSGGATASGTTTQTTKTKSAIKTSVVSVKVVATRNGRVLVVKVQSAKPLATLRIVLAGKNGKVVAKLTRTVKTNKAVRVSHVLVPKSVRAVHVSVLR